MILAHHLELVDSKESFNDEITSSIERETTKKTYHHFFLNQRSNEIRSINPTMLVNRMLCKEFT